MPSTSEAQEVLARPPRPQADRACVLCVDDDPAALVLMGRQLSSRYEVLTAATAQEGLSALAGAQIAVVVADMQMPNTDGATFLREVRQAAPDAVRILITGQMELSAAVASVNEAEIFRFLAKPCSQSALVATVEAAVTHHRLVSGQRGLLEETLQGSIKILSEVLALTNPVSFGRGMRIKQHVSRLADHLEPKARWQLEVAAILSQIGWITLPQETAERLHDGLPLSEAELATVERLPTIAEQLLAHIPRFEVVRGIVTSQRQPLKRGEGRAQGPTAEFIAWGGELLRVAGDFDLLEGQGVPPAQALEIMRGRAGQYDRTVLAAFAARQETDRCEDPIRELALLSVRVGMVLAEDVRTQNGTLLVTRGYEVTESFVERARNFAVGSVREPVRVTMGHRRKARAR
jgi:response regulator RpfG family c-di-GMP phosphodiesterase